ncbi:hypothetical protein [Methylobacterium gnaphalii]|uniref:Uncharacterized protein n=1 Tax=Methylobacterium gnaphalii TaxID=1010610 RepID=A0A512JRV2_9HYPH|nr:hypothetical protein [Methylobacterium gnaphalii]GEP12669.1 hypothetical protein MGN01_45140 [Methylobacterium gnaphalii]GJD71377.1 hypothetical protein MMMDOFMJ_4333 [Methylobacterium gnaphalii]GLS51391.1 hypothetical protein GCM10007885_42480 [Methylobacterium gnaphalii]
MIDPDTQYEVQNESLLRPPVSDNSAKSSGNLRWSNRVVIAALVIGMLMGAGIMPVECWAAKALGLQ